MSGYVLGIDPGWAGGAALLGEGGACREVCPFANQTESDIIGELDCLLSNHPVSACYIEKVHSMPRQGVASSFKFGWIYGLLRGLVVGKVRTIEVAPQTWQKSLGCLTRGDKNVSKAAAQRLFPGVKVTHSIADSLLISYFGYLTETGRLNK